MKIGYEVEGKMKGLKSLFINEDELKNEIKKIKKMAKEVNQIYISIDAIHEPNEKWIKKRLELLKKLNVFLTVEIMYFVTRPDVDMVMLRLEGNNQMLIEDLKKTDSIKIHTGKNNVYSISIENMFFTKSEDFDDDIIL